jgi:hypothetical protein
VSDAHHTDHQLSVLRDDYGNGIVKCGVTSLCSLFQERAACVWILFGGETAAVVALMRPQHLHKVSAVAFGQGWACSTCRNTVFVC